MTSDYRGFDYTVTWATSPKWATSRESESIGAVESLDGNLGIVMVDVQGSGSAGGRRLALSLSTFARNLLESGVGALDTATATHQHLAAAREGKVSASIHCLTIDLARGEAVVAGFGPLYFALRAKGRWEHQSLASDLAGFGAARSAAISSFAVNSGSALVVANDGVGDLAALPRWQTEGCLDPGAILDLSHDLESGRPKSDKSVVVITMDESPTGDRRRTGRLTLPASVRKS